MSIKSETPPVEQYVILLKQLYVINNNIHKIIINNIIINNGKWGYCGDKTTEYYMLCCKKYDDERQLNQNQSTIKMKQDVVALLRSNSH